MSEPASSLVCAGCGTPAPPPAAPPYPFRCPNAGRNDGIDHVLRRVLDPWRVVFPRGRERNPFIRYRQLLHSYHTAVSRALSDADYVSMVQRLDREILRVDGRGFVVTPVTTCDRLAAQLGLGTGRLWVKDETSNVSGSHKARHLFGVMMYLQVMDALRVRLKPDTTGTTREPDTTGTTREPDTTGTTREPDTTDATRPPEATDTTVVSGFPGPSRAEGSRTSLAIASCGNAALAAAVVARAAGRDLDVFVPTWADELVVARLRALGARLTSCPREPGLAGDPCYHRFHDALGRGALPFCCQGPDNGLTIEGGSTLVWEILDALGEQTIDRLFVQVGGGALASACAGGLTDAVKLGRLSRLPRVHAVQTAGGFPLARAYDRLLARVLPRIGDTGAIGPRRYRSIADGLLAEAHAPIVREELRYAAAHRSEFMWPWETAPSSVASGILDDETYDWLAVVEGMVLSGGYPVVVDDDTLRRAHELASQTTGINADHTGTAGLAGLMRAMGDDPSIRDETIAVLFTGARRDARS